MIIAHRGASSYKTENTLDAFELAVSQGADVIELDVRGTRDGVLVVSHDRGIKIGKKKAWIDKILYPSLSEKVKKRMPLLEEVVHRFKNRITLNLDIKQNGIEDKIAFLLAQHDLTDKVMIDYHYHLPGLIKLRTLLPKAILSLCPLVEDKKDYSRYNKHIPVRLILNLLLFILKYLLPGVILKKAILVGVDGVTVNHRLINKKLIKLLHEEDIKVYVWTIDNERLMKRFINWGVDGIKTGKPDLLKKVLLAYQFI